MKLIQFIGEKLKDPTTKQHEIDFYREDWDSGFINADLVEKVVVDDFSNIRNKTMEYYVNIYTTNNNTPYIFYSQSRKFGSEGYDEEDKVGLVCARLARTLATPGDELIIGSKEDYVLSSSTEPQLGTKTKIHYLYDYETGEEGFL